MDMDLLKDIEDQAAHFLSKRDSGHWSDYDQAQLVAWMQKSTAHRIAVLRLEAAWESAARLKAVTAGLPSGTVPPPGEWRQPPFFEREASVERHVSDADAGTPPSPSGRRFWRLVPGRARAVAVSLAASVCVALLGTSVWWLWPN